MSFLQYLRDRWLYLLFPFLNILLVLLVLQLAYLEQNVSIGGGNLFYLFLLSAVLLSLVIAIDYLRLRSFYQRLYHVLQHQDVGMDGILQLDRPLTEEQRAFVQLLQANYQQYVDELERYRRMQEQHLNFTNQWVHHMKTPVSVISLLIQQGRGWKGGATAEGGELQRWEELLLEIEEENERFRHGLEMMMHLARLNHFALDLRAEQVELVSLVRKTINEERRLFIRHHIYPKLETKQDEIWVESDSKWLAFVIHQLELNAIKYSPKGAGCSIFFIIEQEGDTTFLHVQDEGIGISKADLPRVFDSFFTGENGRKVKESTGMGLYLSREICRQLGHGLTIDSKQGEGTRVTIRFQSRTTYHELELHKLNNAV